MRGIYTITLSPTVEQALALRHTMSQFDAACRLAASYALANKTFSQSELQKGVYLRIREECQLGAQMAVLAIKRVADAHRTVGSFPSFVKTGTILYDQRTCRFVNELIVSLWTIEGRRLIPYQNSTEKVEFLMGLPSNDGNKGHWSPEEMARVIPFVAEEIELCDVKGELVLNIIYNSYMVNHVLNMDLTKK